MQIVDCASGLRNCLEFSQFPLVVMRGHVNTGKVLKYFKERNDYLVFHKAYFVWRNLCLQYLLYPLKYLCFCSTYERQ